MVEWKKIEDLGPYFGGLTGKTKEDFVDGNAKFITYMNVFANASLDITSTGVVRISDGEKQNKIQKGDILFTGSSETPDEAGMSCVVTEELNEDYYMNSFCFGIRLNNPEQYCLNYLKHILRSSDVRKSISKSASGVTRFNISKARFGKIQIPIPSLEEQTRIVGILDTFTSAIDNLKEQIAQRRKQYEYYRNQLLTFDKVGEARFDVKWMKLGEVCDFQNGFAFKSTLFKTQGAPIIRITNINGNYIDEYDMKYFNVNDYNTDLEQYKVYQGDILIAMSGATTGKIGCSLKNKIYYLNQRVGKFIPHKQLDKRYLFHVLSSKTLYLYYLAGGGAQPNLSSNKLLNDFVIPIPPLEEQQRIVSILDTFEASIQNLEAQLDQREKQYEYYRNKLLTFE